ncbi:protein-tyrosine phosphatase [Actinocorallia herbida]|uniref:Protein-tyrosine phosphatase n=1 Tax=Actinocorallia herbida TaxID=58109 RepID=A0A3N1CWL2_9ACTN|nr:tyrosine-protein phosphatase [Actinocorallia herbida]ROO85615.1 protein-tyrosine phosphatase [Actinocorallia herbida]
MKNLASAASTLTVAVLILDGVATGALAAPRLPQDLRAARIPFTAATVTANDDGSFTVSWKAPGVKRVAVKAVGRTVARGDGAATVTVRGLPAADRRWFSLVPDHGGSLHLADRLVRLSGTVNFRDAGGYRTKNGKWVRMGKVYRTDALNKLTTADQAKLKRLGIELAYDLRTGFERALGRDKLPSGIRLVIADVSGGGSGYTLPTSEQAAEQMMIDGERAMVASDSGRAAYTSVFDGLAGTGSHAVLFHCTAGKDRTGWAAAALLTALGVPRATIMRDYLASNDYRAAANASTLDALPPFLAKVYKPLLDVRPAYLNAGFDQVKETFGTFPAYEKDGLGLTAAELKHLKAALLVG